MSGAPTQESPLVLIDASGWLFRAFHALPPLTNAKGEPSGAIYGMGNMLRKLLKDFSPERIAVVFDPPGPTFREKIYAEYKANRDETPAELTSQFPVVCEMVRGMGLPLLEVPGFEADDVIGTLTVQARQRHWPVLIVTSDKDMAQLVDGQVELLDTMKNRRIGPDGVLEKFGVPPERIIDYLALVGDTSDNIPGVPLVGPKTAAKWLQQHGSLDAIIKAAASFTGKTGDNLRASLDQLPVARQLATIRCDLALPVTLDDLKPGAPDAARLTPLYQRYGFNRWLDELGGAAAPASERVAAATPPEAPAAAAQRPASPPTRFDLVLEAAALANLVKRLESAPLICLDTETDSLDSQQARLVGLSFAVQAGHGWYVPVGHNSLTAPKQLPLAQVLDALRPVLEDARRPKLGQHLKYDLNVLFHHGVQVRGVAHDTMLQSYVLDAAANRHDMDTLAEKYLNHRTIKYEDVTGKGRDQVSFSQVDVDKAAAYSAEDADITLRLHHVLYPRICEVEALKRVYETIEMPLVPVLAQVERNGVKVDAAMLGRVSVEFAQRMDELQKQCWKEAGTEFNLGSPAQLQTVLYDTLKLPVLGRTPKGQPSTAEDVLEELAAQHALPRLILEWRGLSKLRSTYTENLPRQVNPKTGRIHTSYHQAVAATGRLSSSDPNLQNIPVRDAEGRRIRQAFVAEPGNLLASIDYSQIELRLMAHLSGDARLQEAFRAGGDVHRATAGEVFGVAPEAVSDDQRRAAKTINFGLIYGMSAFGLAQRLGIARGEAQAYMEKFFERYAGVKSFMDGTRASAAERGYVETLLGRRLYLPNIRARNAALRQYAERTAINAPLQGTAADLIKLAMIDVARFIQDQAPELRMIMQVHDELVFEGPAKTLTAMAPALADRMCRIYRLSVPLVADWGIGSEWNQAHNALGHASH